MKNGKKKMTAKQFYKLHGLHDIPSKDLVLISGRLVELKDPKVSRNGKKNA